MVIQLLRYHVECVILKDVNSWAIWRRDTWRNLYGHTIIVLQCVINNYCATMVIQLLCYNVECWMCATIIWSYNYPTLAGRGNFALQGTCSQACNRWISFWDLCQPTSILLVFCIGIFSGDRIQVWHNQLFRFPRLSYDSPFSHLRHSLSLSHFSLPNAATTWRPHWFSSSAPNPISLPFFLNQILGSHLFSLSSNRRAPPASWYLSSLPLKLLALRDVPGYSTGDVVESSLFLYCSRPDPGFRVCSKFDLSLTLHFLDPGALFFYLFA
jgi:hypothetical protein